MDRLADGLAAASLSDTADQSAATAADAAGVPSADYLLSVMRAVEGTEATMRSQLEENNRLKEELMRKTQQLQRMDVASKIMAFSQQGPRTTCIISANGTLHGNIASTDNLWWDSDMRIKQGTQELIFIGASERKLQEQVTIFSS